ncbi:hypothetical protein ACFVRB_39545 [Streptomyces nojiriensis]|uniref:hypothetical protein n=1 Tax=Streptomyces nojiriensis TaxID=66374 RepID=UPI0036D9DF51
MTVGPLVGRAVHKHTGAAVGVLVGAAAKGDVVGAIGAAAAVITALFPLLCGGGSAWAGPGSRPTAHTLASHQVSRVRPTRVRSEQGRRRDPRQ